MSALPASWRVYRDPRMLALLVLGFSSGLPRLLVYSTLSFWLLEEGLTIASVGLFAATALPYNLKFLWAPLVDRLRIVGLTRRLGLRRSWILCTQLALALAIAALSTTSPGSAPVVTAIAALVVAVLSATQDIAIDGYRVELLRDEEQGAGAAAAVCGYRVGMLAAGAGALYLAAWLGRWDLTYLCMAALMLPGLVTTLFIAEPQASEAKSADARPVGRRLWEGLVSPLLDLASRRGAALLLIFVVVYKLGDALAATMLNPFLVDLSFTKLEIANVAKTYGLAASIVGVVLGGALVRRLGIAAALLVAGLVQMLSNGMFALQAVVGHDLWMLVATIGVENLTAGLGTAAFVAYLSALCNRAFTATQYAFLTAVSSFLQTIASTSSGFMAAGLGWTTYFLATMVAAAPALVLLLFMIRTERTGLEDRDFRAAGE